MDSSMTLLSIVSGVSALVSLLVQVGLVVLVATVVRRHRPDAYGPLLVWSGLSVAFHLVGMVLTPVLMFVAGRGGTQAIVAVQTLTAGVGLVFHVTLAAILAHGLVKLAEPPRPPHVEGAPPYR
ncbi:MAG TPA: hypothetical protein PK141_22140 [Polyangiaceae bacterium]|nr:hypothetical protein [Polyangiaceae bacterium]